ncbi:hypothetical protein HDU96_007818 [Phlyctochytrium bullatum]|nr:hypothetical protein HDU96_007818 [Phlyctochytrium bullatum]
MQFTTLAAVLAFAASASASLEAVYYGNDSPAPVVPKSTSTVVPVVPTTTAVVKTSPVPVVPYGDDKETTKLPLTSTKVVATVPADAGYYGKPPVIPSTTKVAVVTTPAYTPECEGEPTSSAKPVVPVPSYGKTATPTATPTPTTKAVPKTNIVVSGAGSLKASAFVAAAAGVAALFL